VGYLSAGELALVAGFALVVIVLIFVLPFYFVYWRRTHEQTQEKPEAGHEHK
jgi:preprotein translocase subunit YajC